MTPRPKPDGRLSACKRGYGRDWQALRLSHLADNPLCVACEAKGITTEATEVDHITPHKGDHELRMDPTNLQALCSSCHGRKTATQDGGFGRAVGVTGG